jgi:hypothetical protein
MGRPARFRKTARPARFERRRHFFIAALCFPGMAHFANPLSTFGSEHSIAANVRFGPGPRHRRNLSNAGALQFCRWRSTRRSGTPSPTADVTAPECSSDQAAQT